MKAYNKIQTLLTQYFFTTATTDEVKAFLTEIFDSANNITEIEELYTTISEFEISPEIIEAILDISEWKYISGGFKFLCKYIYELYKKINKKALEKYYFNILYNNGEISGVENCTHFKCTVPEKNIKKYNNNGIFYTYQEQQKEYGVYSFSDKIGLNMTMLKTPYGAVLFDCGAKIENYGLVTITPEDVINFLRAFNLTVNDVIAVVISHAHLDHYGSINSLVKAGIPKSLIYIEKETKRLIADASIEDYLIDDYSEINSFHFSNKTVQIHPFKNGHILGSNGYVVSFDNQNVVYTGDFSLHDQPIVKGLKFDNITNLESVIQYGISCLITETTYGTQKTIHSTEEYMELMKHFVDLAVVHGYKVFIPSFAVGKSQEVAFLLKKHKIIIDGLAIKTTHTYERLLNDIKIFDCNTHFASHEIDNKLRNYDLHDIIIASSGMISQNSTSYNYIKEFLERYDDVCIIRSGFISSESIGKKILNEWRNKKNILLDIPLSAHASKDEIISLINTLTPNNVILIHGDGLLHA